MNSRRLLQQTLGLTLIMFLLTGCGRALAESAATSTPAPTPTPTPFAVGEWLEGHFWSIKVAEVKTETELDGEHPTEDVFVLVDVQWKANGLEERHIISGMDFQLVDGAGEQYDAVGMIFEDKTYDSYSAGAKFQKGNWWWSQTSGTKDDTFRLVYDVPSSGADLKLWFQDFPLIDLGLELP